VKEATKREPDNTTPRPWRVDGYQIYGADGEFVGSTFNKQDDALIVRAVNSFDALLSAAKDATYRMEKVRQLLKANGAPNAEWNVLDTKELRAAISLAEKDSNAT